MSIHFKNCKTNINMVEYYRNGTYGLPTYVSKQRKRSEWRPLRYRVKILKQFLL